MKSTPQTKMKEISVGDILLMHKMDEVIEIVELFPEDGIVHYWTDKFPEEVGTDNCRLADAWIIFEYGELLTSVFQPEEKKKDQ